jgi:hypothetical protein
MKCKPYSSPIWPYMDVIRAMRRGRKTWKEIAAHLEQEHGLKTSHKTIQNFFKRVADRTRKGVTLPMGFESEKPNRLTARLWRTRA